MNAPAGYCEPHWNEKLRMGPQHILNITGNDTWMGLGMDMPSGIQFLIRNILSQFDNENWRDWKWVVNIAYLECRNCDHSDIAITTRNDGLFHHPIIHSMKTIELKGA